MIRCALYVHTSHDPDWTFVAIDHLEEREREDFRYAAIRFAESDRSFGGDSSYAYLVMKGIPPTCIPVKEMYAWEKL